MKNEPEIVKKLRREEKIGVLKNCTSLSINESQYENNDSLNLSNENINISDFKKNKIKLDEVVVQSGSERGLSKSSEDEIQNWVHKAYKKYYFNLGYIGKMIGKAINRRDTRMLKAGFHLLFSKENIIKNQN